MVNHYLFLFLLLISGFSQRVQAETDLPFSYSWIDEEYDRYKKRGDEFFAQGAYDRAKGQYENCLEVPGFANDAYAKGRIELCKKAIMLRQDAMELIGQGKEEDAISIYQQMLAFNPSEPVTRSIISDYWSREGNKLYAQRKYAEAKNRYQEALKFTDKKDLLLIQIENCDQFLAQQRPVAKNDQKSASQESVNRSTPDLATGKTQQGLTKPKETEIAKPQVSVRPSNRAGLKLATAAVGLGAVGYAYLLYNQYDKSLTALKSLNAELDPSGSGMINSEADFGRWNQAYNEAQDANSKEGVYKACLGVAAVAAAVETYLLVHKPKLSGRRLSFKTATTSLGLSLQYTY